MKVLLDIQENRASFFMQLIKSLDYIQVIKEIKGDPQSQLVQDLAEAFNDVKLYENLGENPSPLGRGQPSREAKVVNVVVSVG